MFKRYSSDSETLTAFGTAGTDNSAAATGFHANPETVGSFASDNRRLKSTFHDQYPKTEELDFEEPDSIRFFKLLGLNQDKRCLWITLGLR